MIVSDFKKIISFNLDWERFAGKNILITGANGVLPAYMVKTIMYLNETILAQNPCTVIALVRSKKKAEICFDKYINNNLVLLIQDVCSDINIKRGVDFIIHAASPASPKMYKNHPLDVIYPNVLGTKNVLDFAVTKEVESYLYFSSSEIYGKVELEAISENDYGILDPTEVRSCYAESKRMGENLCISYSEEHNIPVKIVRPFHTYGPGMKLDDGRVFADFVANIVRNENIKMKSSGNTVRSFCYLADATAAFFTILLKGKDKNAYNVGNPSETISIKDLAELLVSSFPEKNLKVMCVRQSKNYLESPAHSQIPNISKIRELGWIPKTTIQEGFIKTVNSYNL